MISTIQTERRVVSQSPSLISWGAVFSGWLIGNAIMLLMFNFGSAVGLSTLNLTDPAAAGKGLAIGAVVWAFITWAVSFFLAGFFSGRLGGVAERMTGALHGLTVWGLAIVFAFTLSVIGTATAVKAGQSIGKGLLAGGVAMQQSNAANPNANNSVVSGVENGLKDRISGAMSQAAANGGAAIPADQARRALDRLDQGALASIAADLTRGDTDAARTTLIQATGLSTQQADGVMAGLSANVAQAKDAAQTAAGYSAGALWAVFLGGVISLIAAAWGGVVGAGRLTMTTTVGRYE